jgi:hypothetical protein
LFCPSTYPLFLPCKILAQIKPQSIFGTGGEKSKKE